MLLFYSQHHLNGMLKCSALNTLLVACGNQFKAKENVAWDLLVVIIHFKYDHEELRQYFTESLNVAISFSLYEILFP